MASKVAYLESLTPAQLAEIPATKPPPGITANFTNPEDRFGEFLSVVCPFFALASLAWILRIYMRIFESRKIRVDDFTLTIGFFMAITYFVCIVMGYKYGAGQKHYWDVHLDQAFSPWNFFNLYAASAFLLPALGLIKATFLFQYWYLFKPIRYIRIGVFIGLFVVLGFYIPCGLATIVLAAPWPGESLISVVYSWHFPKIQLFIIPASIIGVITDFYILVLPLHAVYQLQMPTKKKIGVFLIILTGGLACAASVVALVFRVQYNNVFDDVNYKVVPFQYWTQVEMYCGVIAACMPSVYQFWNRYIKPIGSQAKSSLGANVRNGMVINSNGERVVDRRKMLKIPSNPSMRGFDLEPLPSSTDDISEDHSHLAVTSLYHQERLEV